MVSSNDFKKLGQLDRIEYLLKKQTLGEKPTLSDGFSYWLTLISFGILLAFSTLMAGVGAESFFSLLNKIVVIGFIFIFLQVISNSILISKWNKREKQIEDEYFSLEPRVKGLNLTKLNPIDLMKQVKAIQPMVEEELKKQSVKKQVKKKR